MTQTLNPLSPYLDKLAELERHKVSLEKLPFRWRREFLDYLLFGAVRPGSTFLLASLMNDAIEMALASEEPGDVMTTASWLFYSCPVSARGDPQRVNLWINSGGLSGKPK